MGTTNVRLTDVDRELLEWLAANAEFQVNTWAIPVGDKFRMGTNLQSLKRRGLVDAEGRMQYRQWWITEAGKAALAT